MARLTKAQRSAAAKKGWRKRKQNPYTRRESEHFTELRHDTHFPI